MYKQKRRIKKRQKVAFLHSEHLLSHYSPLKLLSPFSDPYQTRLRLLSAIHLSKLYQYTYKKTCFSRSKNVTNQSELTIKSSFLTMWVFPLSKNTKFSTNRGLFNKKNNDKSTPNEWGSELRHFVVMNAKMNEKDWCLIFAQALAVVYKVFQDGARFYSNR